MATISLPPPPDAFEREALGHLQSLLTVAMRLTRKGAEAEDLVQDTYVKAMRARSQFEVGTNMRAWLLRILTNTFINRYRRGGLERTIIEGPDAEPLLDGWVSAATLASLREPEAVALRPVLVAEIRAAVEALPEEFRIAVLLADVEELSYKEVAEIMGCPIGTVMSRLHRGRRILKAQLIEHARAIGIVAEEPEPAEVELLPVAQTNTVDLGAFRKQKRAAR